MSKHAVGEQVSITENPLRTLRPARIPEYGDSETIVERDIEQMRDTEGRQRSRIWNCELKIGELVGSLTHLRLKSHERRVGNGCIEPLSPSLVPSLARLGK